MMEEKSVLLIKEDLNNIYKKSLDYLNHLSTILEDTKLGVPSWHGTYDKDYFWNQIPKAEQETATILSKKMIEIVGKVLPTVKSSPLLSDADINELSLNIKTFRAALHLRKFYYREAEILHDEGVAYGFNPASQSDDDPLELNDAISTVHNTFSTIMKIIDLIVPGEERSKNVLIENQNMKKYRPDTAFIMMWMDNERRELDDVRDIIKEVFNSFGIKAIRADDIEHEDVITKKIIEEIETSEFLIADLTGARPSVYYEVGYAHAIGKRVILFRKKDSELHFDLSGYNCPEYVNLGDLKSKLKNRLQHLLNQDPAK